MTLSLPPTETPGAAAQQRGYEGRDIPRRTLPLTVLALLIAAVILHFVTYWIYRNLQSRPRDVDAGSSAVAPGSVPSGRTLPPLLPEDVRPLREHENAVFEKLGWKTSGNTADVRIPDAVVDALKERK